jgi:hypothetical protein
VVLLEAIVLCVGYSTIEEVLWAQEYGSGQPPVADRRATMPNALPGADRSQ